MQSKGIFVYEEPSNMQSIDHIFKNNGIQLYDSRVHIKNSKNLNVIFFFLQTQIYLSLLQIANCFTIKTVWGKFC